MKGYTRDSVDMHNDRLYSPRKPAINIKCYHFPHSGKIEDKFKCNESVAEKAGEYAFNSACREFWEYIPEIIEKYFPGIKYYQSGRLGGWIEFELEDPESWDGKQLNRWAIMERKIRAAIEYYSSQNYVFDMIESNKWYIENAREFNFYDGFDGKMHCIAEDINKLRD